MSHASTAIRITRLEYQQLPAAFWSSIRKYLHIPVTEGVIEVKNVFRKLNTYSIIINNCDFVAFIFSIWNGMSNKITNMKIVSEQASAKTALQCINV